MSAYIVQDRVLHQIVTAAQLHGRGPFGRVARDNPNGLTRALAKMNTDAVNQRYRENDDPEDVFFQRIEYTIPEAAAAAGELLYQCSEGNVPERHLYKALDKFAFQLKTKAAE